MNKIERAVSPFAVYQQQNAVGGPLFRGPLIKLNHTTGQWFCVRDKADVPIPDGTLVVVNPMLFIDSWTKYGTGEEKPVTHAYRVANFEFAPPREELGDNNPRLWRNGKDPWARAAYLPMLLEGEICAFKATGKSALGEIADLCAMYDSSDRKGLLPEVAMGSRHFEANGSTVYVPSLKLVGWRHWENGLLVQQPTRRLLSEIEEPKALPQPNKPPEPEDDSGDSIPF